jgi:serine/threonine-protein kinase
MSAGQGKIFSPGATIQNKWVILEFIDKGAFGEVYRAHQLNLQRDVAIKVVSQEWLKSTLEDDEVTQNKGPAGFPKKTCRCLHRFTA